MTLNKHILDVTHVVIHTYFLGAVWGSLNVLYHYVFNLEV